MKKFFALAIIMVIALSLKAQLNPVSWSFSAKKVGDKTYEIHMTATMQNRWHLYSQNQPDDAIISPTTFTFNPNPLFTLEGKIKEVGKMEKFHDPKLKLSANQYSSSVDFVQVVKLKTNAKTNFSGSVEYQTCDDEKCLPPKTVTYNISIK